MGVMALSEVWPPDRLLTVDDLLDQPDDGNRYELVHGVLDVTPAPRSSHNRAATRLAIMLGMRCPDDHEVLAGNGVNFARDHHRIPDVIIVHSEWVRRTVFIEQPPPLAIEVTSRSTRFRDTITKKREYEKFGIRSYWIVDPDYHRPCLTVFELNRKNTGRSRRSPGTSHSTPRDRFPSRSCRLCWWRMATSGSQVLLRASAVPMRTPSAP
jgi:Uma2 family endonuclease